MASPFSVFRRNQKVLLAIVAISAMIAFVFLDPLMKYVGSNTQVENPVVVETKYGPLTQSQVDGLIASRTLVDRFLQVATAQSVLAALEKGQLDPRQRDMAMAQIHAMWRNRLMQRSTNGPEEAAVETMVLARRAEQLGIVISDRSINELIRQITNNSLSGQQLTGLIQNLGGNRRVSVTRLFDALRTEMLAAKMSELFVVGLQDIPPAQRFEYFESLNRKAKVELVPLAVSSFVAQVTEEPSNEALRAFYEEHKNRLPDPASPEPGFKEPKRASFQYYKIDFARLKEELKPQVTTEEIAKYYEDNKAQFRAVELPEGPGAEQKPQDEAASPDAPAEDKPGEDAGGNEEPADEKPTDGKAAEEKPTGETQPKPAGQPTASEEKPAEDKPAAESQPSADPPPNETKAAPKDGQSLRPSSASRRATVRLVSQESPAETSPPALPAAEATSTDPPAPAQPPAAGPSQVAEPPPAAVQPPQDADKPADVAQPATEKPAEEIKYEPLEKVQDAIRERLASNQAQEKMRAVFDELQASMRRYADERALFNARGDSAKAGATPPSFNFEAQAQGKPVEAKALEMVTSAQAAKTDIGGVQRAVMRSPTDFRTEPFPQFAFATGLPTYKPEMGQDAEGNGYLFWKTAEEAAVVPPLDSIRERVLLAWKTIKARELARKRADELAERARTAGKPLGEVFAGQADLKAIEAGPFTWLSTGNVPFDPMASEPRISTVEGVEFAGQEFMKSVFDLSTGQIGVGVNQPQDTVYVIRLVEYDKPVEELRNEFAAEPPARYMAAAQEDRRAIYRAWLKDLNQDAAVKWLRQADSLASRQTGDEESGDGADL